MYDFLLVGKSILANKCYIFLRTWYTYRFFKERLRFWVTEMTLKINQGHWKKSRSVDHVWLRISLSLQICLYFVAFLRNREILVENRTCIWRVSRGWPHSKFTRIFHSNNTSLWATISDTWIAWRRVERSVKDGQTEKTETTRIHIALWQ